MGNSDAFISKIGAAVPAVTITVVPDAVIVAQGATLGYTVTATNTTVSRQCFSYWENVNLPDGSVFPVKGELFGPLRLCLNAGASKTAHLTHGVAVSAPVGAYVFNAYDGIHPIRFRDVVDTAHFNFDVTALGTATKNPERSWRLIENGFNKQKK